MKEIENQVIARSAEITLDTKKSAKDAAIAEAAKNSAGASASVASPAANKSAVVNADDDFDEFAPVDI